MSTTNFASGDNFKRSDITVGAPVKSTDGNDYWTFPIQYGGGAFGIMELGNVQSTKLKDDPVKKPKILSQGFRLSNPPTRKICEEAEEAIFEGLIKQSSKEPGLPDFLKEATSVADLRAAGKIIKLRGLVHRPKTKDAKGNVSKVPDPTITPLIYGKLIQCGPKHPETPYKIFTRYSDALVLDPDVRKAIAEKKDREENYLLDPEELWKKKLAFECKWSIVAGDVFVSAAVCKIRRSITRVWIVSFIENETADTKAAAAAVAASGERFNRPKLIMPAAAAPGSDDEGGHDSDDEPPVKNNIPPVSSNPANKFDVTIGTPGN